MHPQCQHAAHGTALEPARFERCGEAERSGVVCSTVPWSYFEVTRGHCDSCIIKGELLAQERGLDPGIYCRSMGVSYVALRDANPGSLP
jgi:hypothetical protein